METRPTDADYEIASNRKKRATVHADYILCGSAPCIAVVWLQLECLEDPVPAVAAILGRCSQQQVNNLLWIMLFL